MNADDDFRPVFERFFPRLKAFFQSSGFQAADADDLSQTALWNVYRSRGEQKGETHFEAWVYSIARNVARDEWRRRARRAEDDPVEEGVEDERPTPDVENEGKRALVRTLSALKSLPLGMRVCLLLHVQEGLAYREVAERLSLSPSTVKVQIWNARRRLRAFEEVSEHG
jgi:RNA polymerase sigma-70 factor, ECF subfamily